MMSMMGNRPFGSVRLNDNYVEKLGWRRLPLPERLEKALEWGHEIQEIQEKLFGRSYGLKRLEAEMLAREAAPRIRRQNEKFRENSQRSPAPGKPQ